MNKLALYKVFIFLFLIGFIFFVKRAFFVEPNQLIVRHVFLTVPYWHKEHKNVKFAVIADIHAGAPFIKEKKLKEIVKLINTEQPDIVLILGDFVTQGILGGKFMKPEIIANILQDLKSKHVIAILGNHDSWYGCNKIKNILTKHKFLVLEDDVTKIKINGKLFWIAGLKDLCTRLPNLKFTLNKITDNNPVILLSHSPDIFPFIPPRVSLTLSGHTHGGQVNLPFLGRLIVPSAFGQRYASGHIIEQNKHLFVTNGIGTSIIPIRFRVKPEIVILQLN